MPKREWLGASNIWVTRFAAARAVAGVFFSALLLASCSNEPSESGSGGASPTPAKLGKPFEMSSVFRNIPDGALAPGVIDSAGTVWFTQKGYIYTANESGAHSRIFNTRAGDLLNLAAGGGSFAFENYGTAYLVDPDWRFSEYRPRSTWQWWSMLALSPTGQTFALATQSDVRLEIDGEMIDLPPRSDAYYRYVYVSDSHVVALSDDSVDSWNVDGKPLPRLKIDGDTIASERMPSYGEVPLIALCPEGATDTDPMELRDLRTGHTVDQIDLMFKSSEYGDFIQDCSVTAVDESGSIVVAGSTAGEVGLWDRVAGTITRTQIVGADERISHIAITSGGHFIYLETFYEPTFADPGGELSGRRYLLPVEVRAGGK